MNCNYHNITVNLSLLLSFVQVSQRPQVSKITSAVFKCLNVSSVQGNSVTSLLFFLSLFFFFLLHLICIYKYRYQQCEPLASFESLLQQGGIFADAYFGPEPRSSSLKFWINTGEDAANNLTPCFLPLAVFHLPACLSKGFVPVPGLLERSGMSKSFPVALPFSPAWGELVQHSLNVLEVISKQSIELFFQRKP